MNGILMVFNRLTVHCHIQTRSGVDYDGKAVHSSGNPMVNCLISHGQ